VAGIAGSGQDELLELSPRTIKKRGIRLSFIPEDRLDMGLVVGMSIIDNVLLRYYD
jgi:simple sugar transport system ATP-binding protein